MRGLELLIIMLLPLIFVPFLLTNPKEEWRSEIIFCQEKCGLNLKLKPLGCSCPCGAIIAMKREMEMGNERIAEIFEACKRGLVPDFFLDERNRELFERSIT